jgi:hypothetical protein
MHFATRERTWCVARLNSEIALSRKPFGTGHMYICTSLLRITDTTTSQNIDLYSRDTLYMEHYSSDLNRKLEIRNLVTQQKANQEGSITNNTCALCWI